jgi:hypothetical protein
MKNKLPVIGLSAGLLAGAGAGLIMTLPTSSTAAKPAVQTDITEPSQTDSGDPAADPAGGLVADGTLTQAQADKVIATLKEARPARGPGGHGPGGHGDRGGRGARMEAISEVLGVTHEELHTALQGGQSIADVAKDKGVDVQKVTDALVAEAKTRLDQAVTNGRLTQAEADTRLAEITTKITELVNTPGDELPKRGRRGDHKHDAEGKDIPADEATPTTAG